MASVAELAPKSYQLGDGVDIGTLAKHYAKAFKMTKFEGNEEAGFFAVLGDKDYRLTAKITDQKGKSEKKVIITASEVTRQQVEKATAETKPLTRKEKTSLEADIQKANEEFSKGQSGLLAVAKILIKVQGEKKWQSYGSGFSNWKKFAETNFQFAIGAVEIAIRTVRKYPDLAQTIGITKTYHLCRAGDKVTLEDIDFAKGDCTVQQLVSHLGDKLKGRERTGKGPLKALDSWIKGLEGSAALNAALTDLLSRVTDIKSRLAGIAERKAKKAEEKSEEPKVSDADLELFKKIKAFMESQK